MRKSCFDFAWKNKILQLECKIQVIGVGYTGHHALGLTVNICRNSVTGFASPEVLRTRELPAEKSLSFSPNVSCPFIKLRQLTFWFAVHYGTALEGEK